MSDKLVVQGTPWELYQINDIPVYVKREDLSCPAPGPSFSKIRGVERFLKNLDPHVKGVGVLDTLHSKAGWGVSYICNALGIPCYNFYPVYKREGSTRSHELRYNQQKAFDLGAVMCPLKAGMSAILYHRAKARLHKIIASGVLLPNGLKLKETIQTTADEVEEFTPDELFHGTWVISISSGTICAGVLKGLLNEDVHVIAHMGYSRSESMARKYIENSSGYTSKNVPSLRLIDEGYAYKDSVKESCPFPCNKFYDLKAWAWLKRNIHELQQPIIMWNIGS